VLKANGLAEVNTEPQKMLVLAAFNLVECIAHTAPQLNPRRRSAMMDPIVAAWMASRVPQLSVAEILQAILQLTLMAERAQTSSLSEWA
jgi:hypothetical protein